MGEQTPRYDKRVHALVSDAQKKEWKEATEGDNSDYESVSSLIRTAVQRELADSNPALEGENAGTSAEVEETVLEMADRLESIDGQLSDVSRRLSQVEAESGARAFDLQGAILSALPTDENKDIDSADEWAATVPEVASQVEAEMETVEQELDRLHEETGAVQRHFGEPHHDGRVEYYYRRA
jgi:uncharacterized protein (DUF342 family)